MSDIEQRKRDHINIVLSGAARHAVPAGFDDIRFVHNALPEADLGAIDLSVRFLGKRLNLPFLASSMTGAPKSPTWSMAPSPRPPSIWVSPWGWAHSGFR